MAQGLENYIRTVFTETFGTMKKTERHTEQQMLIALCKQGDQQAQFRLYKDYYRSMYNVSMRIVNNSMEAEDIIQESFLSAFDNLHTFSGEVSFGAWLRKIVVNRSIDAITRRQIIFEDIDEHYELYDETNEEPDFAVNQLEEKKDEIRKAIYKLADGYRIVLSLYLLEGYDHDEIAQILGISNNTSRSQYSRARKQLASHLSQKFPMAS